MQTGSAELWEREEYTYPDTGEFVPDLHWYLHEEEDRRPAIIIVPGGGYRVVSHTEGEVVAQDFYERGYNTFVVTYTTNIMNEHPLKFQPLLDLSAAVAYVRGHAQEFHVFPNRVAVCGFSAGAHLAGSLAVHWMAPEIQTVRKCRDNRPDAVILSYPVITAGTYAHRDSFDALLGEQATEEELDYMSLEKQVTPDMPPCFLWQTAPDTTVPVENSYLMAEACRRNGIFYEHHVFPEGRHGLSLGSEVWAAGDYRGYYTMKQRVETCRIMLSQGRALPPRYEQLNIPEGADIEGIKEKIIRDSTQPQTPDESVVLWPMLTDLFLKRVFSGNK